MLFFLTSSPSPSDALAARHTARRRRCAQIWADTCYEDPYFLSGGRVRGKRFGRRAAASALYEALVSRRHPLDVFESRRSDGEQTGVPERGSAAAAQPPPSLMRAVEVRAGGEVAEDKEVAARVTHESALDERTFTGPLEHTMSEGAVQYASRLLKTATRHSVEHGEVLRCCLPIDPLERARFRVMDLAILRVALAELELQTPSSVVIFEAEMTAKDYCEAGMHVAMRRVLTTYLDESTRGGESGWGQTKAVAPWDFHPEMLLNPNKARAQAVSNEQRSKAAEAQAAETLLPREVATEGGAVAVPREATSADDAALDDLDAILSELEQAQSPRERRAAGAGADDEYSSGDVAGEAGGDEDEDEDLGEEEAAVGGTSAGSGSGKVESAVEEKNRARVESVMAKFIASQQAQKKQSAGKGANKGAGGELGDDDDLFGAEDDDGEEDILDALDLLLEEGYNAESPGDARPKGFGSSD